MDVSNSHDRQRICRSAPVSADGVVLDVAIATRAALIVAPTKPNSTQAISNAAAIVPTLALSVALRAPR